MFSLFRMFGGKKQSPKARFIGFIVVLCLYGVRYYFRSHPWISNSSLRQAQAMNKILDPDSMPQPGRKSELASGITQTSFTYEKAGLTHTIRVYLPSGSKSKKLPVVLIAPAGTPLIHGSDLGSGDQKEELPYVSEGFAVVAYSLDGNLEKSEIKNEKRLIQSATEFRNSEAGVLNARDALDIVLAKLPQLDAKHIFAVGHSSAATIALTLAAYEPRLKGCVAYCPCTDVITRLAPDGDKGLFEELDSYIPNYEAFLKAHSPIEIADKIKCPVLLFASKADDNVPYTESVKLADKLKADNKPVTLKLVAEGDHYYSMIESGIPAGIAWMQQRLK